jgi:putative peptide zinc metalloprotease protein
VNERIRLRSDVRCVALLRGQLLFVASDSASLRVSAAVQPLVDPLLNGATFLELVAAVRKRQPGAAAVEDQLMVFIGQLTRAGLIDGMPRAGRPQLRRLFVDPDPLLRPLARLCKAIPLPLAWLVAALSTLGAIAELLGAEARSQLHVAATAAADISIVGIALFVSIALPLHELAHALAARVAGVPVRELGLLLVGSVLPRPYVRTPDAIQLRSRARRAGIALAGPFSDLLVLGAAAHFSSHPAARCVMLLMLLALAIGTSPLREGDGSHALECLLGDDLARRSALARRRSPLTTATTVHTYRLACCAHTALVGLASWRLW